MYNLLIIVGLEIIYKVFQAERYLQCSELVFHVLLGGSSLLVLVKA